MIVTQVRPDRGEWEAGGEPVLFLSLGKEYSIHIIILEDGYIFPCTLLDVCYILQ